MEQEETIEYLVGSKRLNASGLDASSITSTSAATTVQPTMSESLANEDVFETTGDLLAESVQNQLQTLESQKTLRETLREHLGPLSRSYFDGDRESDMDRMYGIYLDKDGMMFGSKRFDVDKADNIIIEGVPYVGTPVLYARITLAIGDCVCVCIYDCLLTNQKGVADDCDSRFSFSCPSIFYNRRRKRNESQSGL